MYERTIKEVPLFENADKSFFKILGKNVHEKYYRRGHVIVRAYDVVESVFIIYRGKVMLIGSVNNFEMINFYIHRLKLHRATTKCKLLWVLGVCLAM